ncbi:MAG: peptidase M48 Ste24p, partial [Acidiferrobacterales bacterium]
MRTLTAAFYDGKTSERKEVQLQLDEAGRLFIRGLEDELVYPLADVKVAPRVGNTPRSIYLPGGAKCETLDNDAIDAFLQRRGRADWSSWLHRLESRLGYVLVALVLTVVTVWGL